MLSHDRLRLGNGARICAQQRKSTFFAWTVINTDWVAGSQPWLEGLDQPCVSLLLHGAERDRERETQRERQRERERGIRRERPSKSEGERKRESETETDGDRKREKKKERTREGERGK